MKTIENTIKDLGIDLTPELKHLIYTLETTLEIPKKVEAKLKYIPKKDFLAIYEDVVTAKELTLVILSNFSNTTILSRQSNKKSVQEGYKELYSKILQKQVDTRKSSRYKRIIDILLKYKIIEKGKNYSTKSNTSNSYRLTKSFFGYGSIEYQIKTIYVKKLSNIEKRSNLDIAVSTVIGRNAIFNLDKVVLPEISEVENHLELKIKQGFKNKRGKKLVKKGRNSARYPKDKYVFFEDYIEDYLYLKKFFNIPIVTDEKAGHRVITKFNLMPSVIRELLILDGKRIVESDYSSLHPNIANTIYRGKGFNINHDKVASYLNIHRKEAKIEHLSFFNKRWNKMKESPLFKYYSENEPELMKNIYEDKKRRGHKITSQKMFDLETQIMTSNIDRLQNKGIDVIYVFDALYCNPDNLVEVKDVMNKTAKEFKVNTISS